MIGFLQKEYRLRKKFKKLCIEIEAIRNNADVINICASPTGYSWLGVYNAGLSLFPNNTVMIPQYYSQQLLSEKQLNIIAELLCQLNFSQIVFNGFPIYFRYIVLQVKKLKPNIKIGLIHHGFPSELTDSVYLREAFQTFIFLAKEHKIDKLAFVKKGFEKTISNLYDLKTFSILYKNPRQVKKINLEGNRGNLDIGVLVNAVFRKNLHTQVMAGLLVRGAKVHVSSVQNLSYLNIPSRLVEHGHLTHDTFLQVLASMTVNLHVTFSEASGGQVFTESLSQGVPCLTSKNSGYLDYSPELQNYLIVPTFDDAYGMSKKIENVLENRDKLSELCLEYSEFINIEAEKKIHFFLDA